MEPSTAMEASLPQLQPQPLQSLPPAPSSVGRRLPPPCWSHEETVALIDSYRDKWYSLRRGNLRALHWQEVADAVGALCPHSAPAKTSVQCRHKMEKLRKRYRSELQRALSIPGHRFSSAWVYFRQMDLMEKGISPEEADGVGNDDLEDEDEDDVVAMENGDLNGVDYVDVDFDRGGFSVRGCDLKRSFGDVDLNGVQAPSRFRSMNYGKFDKTLNSSFNGHGSGSSGGMRYATRIIRNGVVNEPESGGGGFNSSSKSGQKSKEGDEMKGVVTAIKALGEGFVKVEKMKMDMMKSIERNRMEMEMKRTEMVLDSQQRLVDAFVKVISEEMMSKAKRGSPQKSADDK